MTALAGDRSTPRRDDRRVEQHPMGANVTIFTGAIVVLNAAGWAVPGTTAVGLKAVGRAEHRRVGTGVNGEVSVRVRRDTFQYANSGGGDAITRADIGTPAYIVDDQTVAKTNGGGTRSAAGTIRDVDAGGVWIDF